MDMAFTCWKKLLKKRLELTGRINHAVVKVNAMRVGTKVYMLLFSEWIACLTHSESISDSNRTR